MPAVRMDDRIVRRMVAKLLDGVDRSGGLTVLQQGEETPEALFAWCRLVTLAVDEWEGSSADEQPAGADVTIIVGCAVSARATEADGGWLDRVCARVRTALARRAVADADGVHRLETHVAEREDERAVDESEGVQAATIIVQGWAQRSSGVLLT